MQHLKTFWPTAFLVKKGDAVSLVIQLVILLVVCAVVGWLIGVLAGIPIVGILFALVGALLEIYSLVGIVLCILRFIDKI